MDTNGNDIIKTLLTPKCDVRVSPGFSSRVMDAIEAHQRRHLRVLGWSINRKAAIAAASFAAVVCAAAAVTLYSAMETPVAPPAAAEPDTIVSISKPAPPQLPLKYSDARLSVILSDVADRYGCSVVYASTADKDIRLHLTIDSGASLEEAVKILNKFDDIDIDLSYNTLTVR